MKLPKDPMILVSYINTQLRDYYPSLDELCKTLQLNESELCDTLASIDYHYQKENNQFI